MSTLELEGVTVTSGDLTNADGNTIDTLVFSHNVHGMAVTIIKNMQVILPKLPSPLLLPDYKRNSKWIKKTVSVKLLSDRELTTMTVPRKEFEHAVLELIEAYRLIRTPPKSWSITVGFDRYDRHLICTVYFKKK